MRETFLPFYISAAEHFLAFERCSVLPGVWIQPITASQRKLTDHPGSKQHRPNVATNYAIVIDEEKYVQALINRVRDEGHNDIVDPINQSGEASSLSSMIVSQYSAMRHIMTCLTLLKAVHIIIPNGQYFFTKDNRGKGNLVGILTIWYLIKNHRRNYATNPVSSV
jgi:hypothetical protein